MNTKIEKIEYAVRHNPNLIPILINDCSIKNGLIYSRMRRLVPRRVGIEFECTGNPANYLKRELKYEVHNIYDLKKIFNLLDYDQDLAVTGVESDSGSVSLLRDRLNSIYDIRVNDNANISPAIGDLPSFNELRVSIKDYSQLRGLYRILDLFKNSCNKPIGGGIHIHIDFRDYDNELSREVSSKYIFDHLKEVEDIFPKYTGTYNKRIVGIGQKGTYVNLSLHGSIEFRIAPLTFDYEILIDWIIKCNKFVTKLIHECHLDHITRSNKKDDYHIANYIYHYPTANDGYTSYSYISSLRNELMNYGNSNFY